MITIRIPSEGPLYDALWRSRRVEESIPRAAVRAIRERLLPRPPVPAAPILSFVEVSDE